MANVVVIGIGGSLENEIREQLSDKHILYFGGFIQTSREKLAESDVAVINAFQKDREGIENSLGGKEILCIYPEGDGMCRATKLKADGRAIVLQQRFPLERLGMVVENHKRI